MSNIYKKAAGLASQINEERAVEKEQTELREKHNVEDENVLIVEKPSLIKFILKLTSQGIKDIATILILALATVGVLCIIYPGPREALIEILFEIRLELLRMFR